MQDNFISVVTSSNIIQVTSESTGSSSYSTQTLPRRVKKASVVLREKRQSMMMIQVMMMMTMMMMMMMMMSQESQEMVSGVFTLPRVSCYHRSTR